MTHRPHIIILGAGPAGLGAASQLARRGLADVTVLEQNAVVGGNAASFDLAGIQVDYGSHRLHPACDPEILSDIQTLIGDDLLDRPRHGRIYLQNRWIHFPLQPINLLLHANPGFAFSTIYDMLKKTIPGNPTPESEDVSFASVLKKSLGPTVYNEFYAPYATKIWGVPPQNLSDIQAQRRVSANSPAKILKKVFSALPGLKKAGTGRFYYPRQGFGQISEAYAQAARSAGAQIVMNARVISVEDCGHNGIEVKYTNQDESISITGDYVWSTIPITLLAKLLKPGPPEAVLHAATQIDYRAMLLIYLVVEQQQFTEYDAHYFPGQDVPITRLSEPKNYSASQFPANSTVLCAELPCSPADDYWSMLDAELGELVLKALEGAHLPFQGKLLQVATRRLRNAYPIYLKGYQSHFDRLDSWIGGLERVLTFGRQGLFAHDNTHHALFMAYSAANCLGTDGAFDKLRWIEYRQVFESHVVED